MRATTLTLLTLTTLSGCFLDTDATFDMNTGSTDMRGCTPTPDLATPAAKCAAAKGLAGDNLICVDFDKVSSLSSLSGWDFTSQCPFGWATAGGKLQVNNFSTFMGSCIFTMPATDFGIEANKKYKSVTLSIVQRVDIDESKQKIQALLGLDDPSTRLFAQMTGREQRVQWTQTITSADLPSETGGVFQPFLKFTSGAQVGTLYQGWLIESIAVNANQ